MNVNMSECDDDEDDVIAQRGNDDHDDGDDNNNLLKFFREFLKSRGAIVLFIISMLFSFGIGTVVGLIPDTAADRYARFYYGYDGMELCSSYENNNNNTTTSSSSSSSKPVACMEGSDMAQSSSAWSFAVMNILSLVLSPIFASNSDKYGRKKPLLLCLFTYTIPAFCFVGLVTVPTLNPIVYYASNTLAGIVSYFGIFFASLSDCFSEHHRATAYGFVMAGSYTGYTFGPSLVLYFNDAQVSILSLIFSSTAFLVALLFLPETLAVPAVDEPPPSSSGASDQEATTATTNPITDGDHDDEEEEEAEVEDALIVQAVPPINSSSCCRSPPLLLPEEGSPTGLRKLLLLLLRPVREIEILNQSLSLRLLAIGGLLSSMVFASDFTLVVYYIEEYFDIDDVDIAHMFFYLGLTGLVLQGFLLQPLISCFGTEKRFLVATFCCGVCHNLLYGVAQNKTTIMIALLLSQATKLNMPVLSSMASNLVCANQQGRVQGALFAINSIGYALGPLTMNFIYNKTKDVTWCGGPGFMFIFASSLYIVGTILVSFLPNDCSDNNAGSGGSNNGDIEGSSLALQEEEERRVALLLSPTRSPGVNCDLEEPLLPVRSDP